MAGGNSAAGLRAWISKLRDQEERCISLIRPFNVKTMTPVLRRVSPGSFEAILCDYFRLLLSSAPQKAVWHGTGGASQWLMFDGTSGGLLGFFSFFDMSLPSLAFDQFIGAQVGGVRRGGLLTSRNVQELRRCIPIWDFGPLTGGKLLALSAISTEVIRTMEIVYGFDMALLVIKTLHDRTSQYNRLHTRGISECPALSVPERMIYHAPLHEHWYDFIGGRRDNSGVLITKPFAEQVDYWRTRWLPNRLDRTDDGWVRPDPRKYLLSPVFAEKLAMCLKKENDDV